MASGFSRKDQPSEFPYRGQGIGVPTLREVLARYPVPLIIELKTPEAALARATVDELRAADAVGRVALGSFYGQGLHAARAYEPRIATGAAREETRWALYKSWVHWPLGRPAFREFQVPERSGRTTIVTPRFVRHAHRAGPAGEGLDGERPRGHRPAALLGRRRHHYRSAGCGGCGAERDSSDANELPSRRARATIQLTDAQPVEHRWALESGVAVSGNPVALKPCRSIVGLPDRTLARLESRHALFEFCSA